MNSNTSTPVKVSLQEIQRNARRISFRLGLMNEWQRIPSQVFTDVRDVLENSHGIADDQLYAKLHAIRKRHRNDFFVCYALLRQSLSLPLATSEEVVRMCRETFGTCLETTEGEILRDELEELLWHGNRRLRGLALRILELAPIGERQTRLLTAEGTYEDQRLAIANLIINKARVEYLKPLLKYMISVVEDARSRETEAVAVREMFGRLANQGYFDPQRLLIELMQAMFDHSNSHEVKGMLLKPLFELQDELVEELRCLYQDRTDPDQRAQMIWLLEKLLARGSMSALKLVFSLYDRAALDERRLLGDALVKATRSFASQRRFPRERFKSEVEGFVMRLKKSMELVDTHVADGLSEINWEDLANESLLQSLIEGTLNSRPKENELRRSGIEAIDFCLGKIRDSTLPLNWRMTAARKAPWFHVARNKPDLPATLWSFYIQGDLPSQLRVELLLSLSQLATMRRYPPGESRLFLEREIQHGAPHLTPDLLLKIWPRLYPSAPPLSVS